MTDLITLGARGITPVTGPDYGRYGGNTMCFSAEVTPGHYLVIGAGTGLRRLEAMLPPSSGLEFTVVLTHYHWSHVQGLPMFGPLGDHHNRFTFYGPRFEEADVGEVLDGVIRPPWFPVRLRQQAAGVVFADLDGPLAVGGVQVTPVELRHPMGSLGLRLDGPERSVMLATDHQAGDRETDESLAMLADRVDVLVHDAQYSEDEAAPGGRIGGHSSWAQAVDAALACRAGRLVLASHGPDLTDDLIENLVRLARVRFPLASGAYEGLRLPL